MALDSGEWETSIIMKRTHDSDMPVGKVRRIPNVLPPPEELFAHEKVRVTVYLSKVSVDYFKKQAQKHHTKYQRMIRELVDHYASRHAA